jgi:hypothetical protein
MAIAVLELGRSEVRVGAMVANRPGVGCGGGAGVAVESARSHAGVSDGDANLIAVSNLYPGHFMASIWCRRVCRLPTCTLRVSQRQCTQATLSQARRPVIIDAYTTPISCDLEQYVLPEGLGWQKRRILCLEFPIFRDRFPIPTRVLLPTARLRLPDIASRSYCMRTAGFGGIWFG